MPAGPRGPDEQDDPRRPGDDEDAVDARLVSPAASEEDGPEVDWINETRDYGQGSVEAGTRPETTPQATALELRGEIARSATDGEVRFSFTLRLVDTVTDQTLIQTSTPLRKRAR